MIVKDFYKLDVYRLDFEKMNDIVTLNINNSTTWDTMSIRVTKEELQGLADFINSYLQTEQ
jgi:ferritin